MISKNIKYYRLLKGMNKKELAEAVDVTPMAISNYENGKRRPEMPILKRIANVLGVQVSDFLATRNKNLSFSHNEFRKCASLSKGKQDLIKEMIEDYASRFMDITEILGENVLPKSPCTNGLTISMDPEKDGSVLRNYLGFSKSGPIDNLLESLENKGFLIISEDIDEDKFSGINGYVNETPYIAINSNMTSERIRSTIAHELAHLMFDWSKTELTPKDIEQYATSIAGAFLFPKDSAIQELGVRRLSISKDMEKIAKKYGISMLLLAKRSEILKIVTPSKAREFYVLASKNGWRKSEPSRIDKERPLLFEQLVYRAVSENEINTRKASELLRIPYKKVVNDCFFANT